MSLTHIPLTEEWLIKFGFEKTNVDIFFKHIGEKALSIYLESNNLTTLLSFDFQETPLRRVKYVHQLQNLYFALTGEELGTKGN